MHFCSICQQNAQLKTGKTNCNHVYCLVCICQHLHPSKNLCPLCRRLVSTVHENDEQTNQQAATILEEWVVVKYCNVKYYLNTSLCSIPDPIDHLSNLFALYVLSATRMNQPEIGNGLDSFIRVKRYWMKRKFIQE